MTYSTLVKLKQVRPYVSVPLCGVTSYYLVIPVAGKIKIESVPFNVRLATEEVLDCVSFLAEERGVELVCDVAGPLLSDGVVLSDPVRFRQVVLNLIGTRIKWRTK